MKPGKSKYQREKRLRNFLSNGLTLLSAYDGITNSLAFFISLASRLKMNFITMNDSIVPGRFVRPLVSLDWPVHKELQRGSATAPPNPRGNRGTGQVVGRIPKLSKITLRQYLIDALAPPEK